MFHGTIVLAFGSNVKWSLAPKNILKAFFGAFEELKDYRIVFSYNGKPRQVPKHIKLSPWMQQKEILNHPKTKLLIGHSGLKSTNEAICAAVPLILMPSFADQKYNSEFFVYLGYAELLNKYHMTKHDVLEAIYEILNNFEVKKGKMEKLRSIYLDKIIQPMNLAEFYVNRAVKSYKNNGKVVFGRKGMDLEWINYLNLDFLLIVFSLIWIVWK
uniref:UDP-glucuronosyltransferase n=1 Tax=Panagrolaimus sp. JU765 TaxID=591449 RepID=A0AC34R626_9BILA